jgi:Holliday junction resolvase RusA-like endonuclease
MERRTLYYTLLGDPIPLLRARHGLRRTWDSQKQIKLVKGIELRNQHNDHDLLSGPLRVDISFYFAIPKSRKKNTLLGAPFVQVPDLDNLIKFFFDLGSGILYDDDKLIVEIISRKLYDNLPRTEIKITEL